MAGSYAKPITIEDAVRHIIKNEYLLPAIQRKFIWRPEQICSLFDSIMRGYPHQLLHVLGSDYPPNSK
ncbi:DUF262 domain-containing protein [Desulfovibrio piger]|uniref:DUF262 domain-containing protein n=1 Tax=Desulfovibrio piger TaxID=901 RepID=UPI0039F4820A